MVSARSAGRGGCWAAGFWMSAGMAQLLSGVGLGSAATVPVGRPGGSPDRDVSIPSGNQVNVVVGLVRTILVSPADRRIWAPSGSTRKGARRCQYRVHPV